MKQRELIKQMSDRDIQTSLLLSQLLLLSLAIILSMILFDHFAKWLTLFSLNMNDIIYYGLIPGIIIVIVDIIIMHTVPKKYYDDGGINERVFKNRSILSICMIALIVSISEELLFRGVIQTVFGYVFASSVFALIHIRYLRKPVLLISIIFVSFYIGYLFEITGNLLVTMTTHFIVDFLLGVIIRYQT